MKGAGQESTCWVDPSRPLLATIVKSLTVIQLSNDPAGAAAADTPVGRAALPNRPPNAIVPSGLEGPATRCKAPPPPVDRSTMRRRRVPVASSPVRQEEVITWFG